MENRTCGIRLYSRMKKLLLSKEWMDFRPILSKTIRMKKHLLSATGLVRRRSALILALWHSPGFPAASTSS